MPLNQGQDLRLADSGGACVGYTLEWLFAWLGNTKPFGFDHLQDPLIKPIDYRSSMAGKFPELNHRMAINPSISKYQTQYDASYKDFIPVPPPGLNSDNQEITRRKVPLILNHSLATNLVHLADQKSDNPMEELFRLPGQPVDPKKPAKGFQVNIAFRGGSGHALGFYKTENHYHFMDSNFGWVRFNQAKDFENWLPFYFKAIGYEKELKSNKNKLYALPKPTQIYAYSLSPAMKPQAQVTTKKTSLLKKIGRSIILYPVVLVTLASKIIRNLLKFLKFKIKQAFKPILQKLGRLLKIKPKVPEWDKYPLSKPGPGNPYYADLGLTSARATPSSVDLNLSSVEDKSNPVRTVSTALAAIGTFANPASTRGLSQAPLEDKKSEANAPLLFAPKRRNSEPTSFKPHSQTALEVKEHQFKI